jgi:hypothetical protein
VGRRIEDSPIPVLKTLDAFDSTYPKKIDREQVLRLFDLDFVAKHHNVCFIARSGLGKTLLATRPGVLPARAPGPLLHRHRRAGPAPSRAE